MLPGQVNQPSPNLLRQTPAFHNDRPHGHYQSFILDALVVGAAIAVSYFYRGFVNDLAWPSLLHALIALAFFAAVSVIEMLLLRDWDRRIFVICLEIAGFLSFFYDTSYMYLSVIALVLLIFLLWGDIISRRALKNSLEIHFFRTVRPLLNKIITGTLLMAVLLYLPHWDAKRSFFSVETFSSFYDSIARFGMSFYPEIQFRTTVGEFSRSIAKMELISQQAFLDLSDTAKARTLDQAEAVIMNSLGTTFNLALDPAKTMNATIYGLVTDALDASQKKFGNNFLMVWAIVVFFALRSFGVVAQAILALFSAVCYQLLLGLNVIHVAGENRVQEVIEYS